MVRGIFAGTLWGALIGFIMIALSSQLSERRELSFPRPEAASLEVPGGSEFDQARDDTDPVAPTTEARPETGAVPVTADQPAESVREAPAPDTSSAAVPQATADARPAPEAPGTPEDTGVEVASGDSAAPVTAAPEPPVPATLPGPGGEVASGDIAQPGAPQSPDSAGVASSGGDSPAPGQLAAALPDADPGARPGVQGDAPVAPTAEQTAPDTPVRPGAPEVAENALAGTGLPQPGFQSTPGVTINRLPQAGDADTGAEGEASADVPVDANAPALVRFAAEFENPGRNPIISIVLLHEPGTTPTTETGLDLPVNVSFAIRAADPEAAEAARVYRAAGREVVMIPSLPPGATPVDVEVALSANFAAIPEAVALLDDPETGFQSERTAIAQVVDVMADTGHGLLAFPRGLNTAQQLAERADLPNRLIFRDIDDGDPNSDVILRAIDRAAFRARQEGVVVLVGRTRPETLAAILEWSLGNALSTVKLAPVSAALLAE